MQLQRKRIIKEIQTDLHFHLPPMLILKNPFFSSIVKIPYQQLLLSFMSKIFLNFMNTFPKNN